MQPVVRDCELAQHVAGWPALEELALRPVDEPGLKAFYERNGFVAARLGDGKGNEEGEPDVVYERALKR